MNDGRRSVYDLIIALTKRVYALEKKFEQDSPPSVEDAQELAKLVADNNAILVDLKSKIASGK